ncbi:MAG: cation diffusion facilitator family transporter [Gammaproteobacteria bacterium PRO9]|nr:cation diffusion facilitator family transporter [Gammaproteobacteria bacterium PRO9]
MGTSRKPVATRRRAFLVRSATYASVSVAVALVLVKLWAWNRTDSIAILSSLADSFLDLIASLLTFWAVRYALEPADHDHRFGHGKAEGLAAFLQSAIITASALYVIYEAVNRFLAPGAIKEPDLGIVVIIAATLLTLALVAWQHYVARKTGSLAIAADAMHYKTDLFANLSVVAGLGLATWAGQAWIDPLVGLGVAVVLLLGAREIGKHAVDILLDHEIPDADRKRIREIACSHDQVLGFHDLRTRHGGLGYIVQFHLELAPGTSLVEAHQIMDAVEWRIDQAYPGCEIIIHPDPLGYPETRDEFGRVRKGAAG